MALPNQPTNMTMTMVAAETGATPPLSLGDARVRNLAGKPSGAISMSDLRGKSAYTLPTVNCATYVEGFGVGTGFIEASASPFFEIIGGEAPFSVVWTKVSGTALSIVSDNPPTFSHTAMATWTAFATYRATVKDKRNNTVTTPDIEIALRGGDPL